LYQMGNILGKLFTITSFGESHGKCIGVIIGGCPAGLTISEDDIQEELEKRKPQKSPASTTRTEEDKAEILSGTMDGITTGAPLCLIVSNKDADSEAYEQMRYLPRPGHADYTAFVKYGGFNDYRGGGIFSGRTTAGLVMAGAVAKKIINRFGIEIIAHTVQIGNIKARATNINMIREEAAKNPLNCADPLAAEKMTVAIKKAKGENDSLGGVVEGIALNVPAGLGEPPFDNMDGELAKAIMAIPAVKGVEFGAGFSVASLKGSENNDPFCIEDDGIITTSNNSGGILGGISNGMPVIVRVAIKPTPSIAKSQATVDIRTRENTTLSIKGRHDACLVPRAVVVIESMMAITICDLAIRSGIIPRVIK